MDEVLKWAGYIGAGWFTASVLLAVAWALAGPRIFRWTPQQDLEDAEQVAYLSAWRRGERS